MKLAVIVLALTMAATTASAETPPEIDKDHAFVFANGIHLHYVLMGDGAPALLVPGWPEDWYTWHDVAPKLAAAGRRIYMTDPRGFGDSDKPSTGYDPDTAAQDLHAFVATCISLTRNNPV